LIAILRGIRPGDASDVVDALLAAGVSAIEFTADTESALEIISRERDRVGDEAAIGIGTVSDVPTVEAALEAAASFVVTPTVEPNVIDRCVSAGVPVIAGGYTPTEAVTAAAAGADMIKIFPASTGGPAHIRAFQGPLDHLRLVPTGGVRVEDVADYISAGATAVGMGGGLVPDQAIENGAYGAITTRAEAVLETINESVGNDATP
jgi:2-dehydro-3-deoxyphosphogluconate aldolase/(4S)-4-hydroxy-2-oxoglutarate aldolase